MRAKHQYHVLLTALDEAPLSEAPGQEPPPVSPAATPASHASPIASVPVAPPQTPSPSQVITTTLDLSKDLLSLLHPTNQLIDSPHRIEAKLLKPFRAGSKDITLVMARNGKTLSATVHAMYRSYLVADTTISTFRCVPGEAVLVIFPVAPNQHYVVQAAIAEVYAFRLALEYRDPRYDVRRQIPLADPVALHLTPEGLISAVATQHVQIVRQTILAPRDGHGLPDRTIVDRFCAPETGAAPPALRLLENRPSLMGTLHDISLGGACLAVDPRQGEASLAHRLVQLTIPFPRGVSGIGHTSALAPLTLQLLGAVRRVRDTSGSRLIHIRFLRRLPQEVDDVLASLEGLAS